MNKGQLQAERRMIHGQINALHYRRKLLALGSLERAGAHLQIAHLRLRTAQIRVELLLLSQQEQAAA